MQQPFVWSIDLVARGVESDILSMRVLNASIKLLRSLNISVYRTSIPSISFFSGICPLAGLLLFHGTVHVGTYCNDGTSTLPLYTKLNVNSIDADGTNQLTIVSFADISVSNLTADYSIFKQHTGSAASFLNPCHTCRSITSKCSDALSIYNIQDDKNMQFIQTYKDNVDVAKLCQYNVTTVGRQCKSVLLLSDKSNTTMLTELIWYKFQVVPIDGKCPNLNSSMKTTVVVSYCSSCHSCLSLVLHCGDVFHSRSTHIKLAVHPGYDWHYVMVQAWWVGKAFPVCKSLVSDVHQNVLQLHDIHNRTLTSQCFTSPATAKHITLHDICGTILVYQPGFYAFHWDATKKLFYNHIFSLHKVVANDNDLDITVVFYGHLNCLRRKVFANSDTFSTHFGDFHSIHVFVLVQNFTAKFRLSFQPMSEVGDAFKHAIYSIDTGIEDVYFNLNLAMYRVQLSTLHDFPYLHELFCLRSRDGMTYQSRAIKFALINRIHKNICDRGLQRNTVCTVSDRYTDDDKALFTCIYENRFLDHYGFIGYYDKADNTHEEIPAMTSCTVYMNPASTSVNMARKACSLLGAGWHVSSLRHTSDWQQYIKDLSGNKHVNVSDLYDYFFWIFTLDVDTILNDRRFDKGCNCKRIQEFRSKQERTVCYDGSCKTIVLDHTVPVDVLEYNHNIFCMNKIESRVLPCAAVYSIVFDYAASFVLFMVPCDLMLPNAGVICQMQARETKTVKEVRLKPHFHTSYRSDGAKLYWMPSRKYDIYRGMAHTGHALNIPPALLSHFQCLDHSFILD